MTTRSDPCPLPLKSPAVPGDKPNKKDVPDPGNRHLQSPWRATASSNERDCSELHVFALE